MKTFAGASGTQYQIEGLGYMAVVTERGGSLREMRYHGRELIVSFAVDEPMVSYRGALAAPWPNRVADGRYVADGATRQLPINEPSRNCSLHGLVLDLDWQLVEHTESEVVLGVRLPAGDGYPFQLDLQVRYAITVEGLTTTIEASNSGTGLAPYGVCPHPYLRGGESPLDGWTLTLPAGEYLRVSPDRLLPQGLSDVADGVFDFRTPRVIGATQIDHAFTGILRDADGVATVEVRDPSGVGVAMSFDESCPWIQVHTADLAGAGRNRLGLAVEPMTCPPDAFNSRVDLVRLAPGECHRASWSLRGLLAAELDARG